MTVKPNPNPTEASRYTCMHACMCVYMYPIQLSHILMLLMSETTTYMYMYKECNPEGLDAKEERRLLDPFHPTTYKVITYSVIDCLETTNYVCDSERAASSRTCESIRVKTNIIE